MGRINLHTDYHQWGYRFAHLTEEVRDQLRDAFEVIGPGEDDHERELIALRNALNSAGSAPAQWSSPCCAHTWRKSLYQFVRWAYPENFKD